MQFSCSFGFLDPISKIYVCVCVCVCCSMGASNTTLSNSQGPAGEFNSVLTLSTHMLYQIS